MDSVCRRSRALAPTKQRQWGHDRGQGLVDLAVALADGATTLSDIRVLADQASLLGPTALVAPVWGTLAALDAAAQAASPRPGPRPGGERARSAWTRSYT
jgi:hypothetical protein